MATAVPHELGVRGMRSRVQRPGQELKGIRPSTEILFLNVLDLKKQDQSHGPLKAWSDSPQTDLGQTRKGSNGYGQCCDRGVDKMFREPGGRTHPVHKGGDRSSKPTGQLRQVLTPTNLTPSLPEPQAASL